MNKAIFVTGATGNVGKETVKQLIKQGEHVIAATRAIEPIDNTNNLEYRYFSFYDASSWETALAGTERIFLMRPPHISNIKRDMLPFLTHLKERQIKQIVFLSVQGAENNPIVPHQVIENYLYKNQLPLTIVTPSFFMQNLTTTHLNEIKDENRLFIPAGKGRTNFIDVRDIGKFCARMFIDREHLGKAYTITGEQSYSYQEVAELLSNTLGKAIEYVNPNPIRFLRYHLSKGRSFGMSTVMLALYTIVRLGKGDITTDSFSKIMGYIPCSLSQFLLDHTAILGNNNP